MTSAWNLFWIFILISLSFSHLKCENLFFLSMVSLTSSKLLIHSYKKKKYKNISKQNSSQKKTHSLILLERTNSHAGNVRVLHLDVELIARFLKGIVNQRQLGVVQSGKEMVQNMVSKSCGNKQEIPTHFFPISCGINLKEAKVRIINARVISIMPDILNKKKTSKSKKKRKIKWK